MCSHPCSRPDSDAPPEAGGAHVPPSLVSGTALILHMQNSGQWLKTGTFFKIVTNEVLLEFSSQVSEPLHF